MTSPIKTLVRRKVVTSATPIKERISIRLARLVRLKELNAPGYIIRYEQVRLWGYRRGWKTMTIAQQQLLTRYMHEYDGRKKE